MDQSYEVCHRATVCSVPHKTVIDFVDIHCLLSLQVEELKIAPGLLLCELELFSVYMGICPGDAPTWIRLKCLRASCVHIFTISIIIFAIFWYAIAFIHIFDSTRRVITSSTRKSLRRESNKTRGKEK